MRTATMFLAALALAGCRQDNPPSKPDAGAGHQHGPAAADGDSHRKDARGYKGHGAAPTALEVLAGGDTADAIAGRRRQRPPLGGRLPVLRGRVAGYITMTGLDPPAPKPVVQQAELGGVGVRLPGVLLHVRPTGEQPQDGAPAAEQG